MAFVECGNGHVYDTSVNATCPYCNGGMARIDFGNGGFGNGGLGKTVMAQGAGQPGNGMFVSSPEIGATVAPASYNAAGGSREKDKAQDDTGKTVAVFKKKMQIEPVVGWFVCIEGIDKGKDYRILAKNNSIGRGDKMDICIKGDETISRENHARIGYDEKHNTFHIIPGESANNIYIDDSPVYAPTMIEAYTVVEIGQTKLLFVPLCNDKFSWKSGMSKE